MKEGWKTYTLGELCKFQRGLTYSKGDEVAFSKNVVLRSNNVDLDTKSLDFSELKYLREDFIIPEDRKVKEGCFLICVSNGSKKHLGKAALIDKNYGYAFGGFMGLLVPDQSIVSSKYLWTILASQRYSEFIKHLSDGTGINNLKFDDIAPFEVPVPPLSEQERIVSYLDTQIAKIDALKANAASQLQAAKDLFQSALKQLLTPKEGWEEKTLGEICISIKDGDWIEKKDQSPFGIRLLQTGNIGVGIYKDKSDSPHYISFDTFNRLHCEEVFAGDILLSRLPEPVGRACLVPKMEGRFITAVDCSIIKVHTEKVTPEYLIYYTQTNAYFKSISSLCTGTTRQRISRKKLEEVSISFPSLSEQERIAARLDSISEKVKALQANYDQTITLCNDLKQSLLKSIFE